MHRLLSKQWQICCSGESILNSSEFWEMSTWEWRHYLDKSGLKLGQSIEKHGGGGEVGGAETRQCWFSLIGWQTLICQTKCFFFLSLDLYLCVEVHMRVSTDNMIQMVVWLINRTVPIYIYIYGQIRLSDIIVLCAKL